MADYREHYETIRAMGADLAAISVDAPSKSEALRRELSLPFSIWCDTERRVIKDWNIYNARERGGIAKPSVFVIDSDGVVRYASVDTIATRAPASEIVQLLRDLADAKSVGRRVHIPSMSDWLRAIRNSFRR